MIYGIITGLIISVALVMLKEKFFGKKTVDNE